MFLLLQYCQERQDILRKSQKEWVKGTWTGLRREVLLRTCSLSALCNCFTVFLSSCTSDIVCYRFLTLYTSTKALQLSFGASDSVNSFNALNVLCKRLQRWLVWKCKGKLLPNNAKASLLLQRRLQHWRLLLQSFLGLLYTLTKHDRE